MDSMQAPFVFAARIEKLKVSSCPGPPCPVIVLLSSICVVVSPELKMTQGGLIGLPYACASLAMEAKKEPASLPVSYTHLRGGLMDA